MPDSPDQPSRRLAATVRSWIDPLVVAILGVLLLGLVLPASGTAADVLGTVQTAAIVVLFFGYGARMSTTEVWHGLRNWRLQGSMLASTFVVFPLLGLATQLLPETVLPQQVRCALTAIQRRTLTPAGTFSADGWLQIGLAGHQPSLGETYISTGSLYLTSAVWLPLGLPPADPFWSAPAAPWTQQKAWSGTDIPVDHAQDI